MTLNDTERFIRAFKMLEAIYGVEASRSDYIERFQDELADLSIDDVEWGISQVIAYELWFPKPADVRKYASHLSLYDA